MSACQPSDIPIEEVLKLEIEVNQVAFNKRYYQRLAGRLIYLDYTRPGMSYALSTISQFMHNPDKETYAGNYEDYQLSTLGYFTFVGENLVT